MADIRVFPKCHPRALKHLQEEAEQLLGKGRGFFGNFKGFEGILVQNSEENPSWLEDLCSEHLPFIDEEI